MLASILLLPGDGIGPEVVSAAASILRAVGSHFGHRFDLREAAIGGAALRRDLPPLPDETLAAEVIAVNERGVRKAPASLALMP